ncbi:hypothetical protein [Pelagibacterium lacus]|uniref:hypothetical protein n=1 Tax=Pelagibacterium lacus TaxID=2282655 RepID=UPI0018F47F1B|nr:hypothetical protein [Pelagibacterium lacus]
MAHSDREQRLAAKLRENLRRRKVQAKARTQSQIAPSQGERHDPDQANTDRGKAGDEKP